MRRPRRKNRRHYHLLRRDELGGTIIDVGIHHRRRAAWGVVQRADRDGVHYWRLMRCDRPGCRSATGGEH